MLRFMSVPFLGGRERLIDQFSDLNKCGGVMYMWLTKCLIFTVFENFVWLNLMVKSY